MRLGHQHKYIARMLCLLVVLKRLTSVAYLLLVCFDVTLEGWKKYIQSLAFQ